MDTRRSARRTPGFAFRGMVYVAIAVAVLVGVGAFVVRERSSEQPKPYNVVLISLDTTRKDHLSCYGYGRRTTPNIDKLAQESLVFQHCVAVSNWTLPTHVSMLTGLYPTTHGAHYVDRSKPHVAHIEPAARMAPGCTSLAELLSDAGYRTGAVIGNWWWLGRLYGLDRGFDHYDHRHGAHAQTYRPASQITDEAIRWLEQGDDRPFFLFLNYMDPHIPYAPPPPYDALFGDGGGADSPQKTWSFFVNVQHDVIKNRRPIPPNIRKFLVDAYDGEIAYMDEHVGRLIDWLRRTGKYENSVIIVTADHGEAFGENFTAGHAVSMYEPEVASPMIVKLPHGTRTGPIDYGVQHVDIAPTVLDILGRSDIAPVEGRSMLEPSRRDLIAVQYIKEAHARIRPEFNRVQWALYRDGLKYIEYSDGDRELYDLDVDPAERSDLSGSRGRDAEALHATLREWVENARPLDQDDIEPITVDEETAKRLRGLGYAQ